jgi:hypothetical protein
MNDEDRLLFACESCADDKCEECAHLTVGAFCPHFCWWLLLADDCKGTT